MRILLAPLLILALNATAAEWPSDFNAALQQARSEKKVLLVHLRGDCDRCNHSIDDALADAEKHAPIIALYDSFVRARVSESDLHFDVPAPSLVLIDPSGAPVIALRRIDPNRLLSFLTSAIAEQRNIISVGALRAAGDIGTAEDLLGFVLIDFRFPEDAKDAFERARRIFKSAGRAQDAELATVHVNFAMSLMGGLQRDQGTVALLRQTRSPMSLVAAQAWLSIARIRRIRHDVGAGTAFRNALALLPADSALAAVVRSELEVQEGVAASGHDATVSLIKPSRTSITGRAKFEAKIAVAAARVEFFLDGVSVASASKAPFQVRIDLGAVPRTRTIRAIAFDANGKPIGEAVAKVNDRADAPRVTLLSPAGDLVSGHVTVEADAFVPAGRTLQNVELYWNETRLAHFDKPPFRVEFEAPGTFGYFRALATLDDGSTAEDTRVVNAQGIAQQVDVHVVAFAAIVEDSAGRRIEGLTQKDFTVRDEGKTVAAAIHSSPDEPVTIGVVIDASASMQRSFLDVLEMASQFLDVAVTREDKAFIAAFDSAPSLIHAPTSDVAVLKKSVLAIRPSGASAVIDGVAFGLQQFTGSIGKRAIVVFTDGRENASRVTSSGAIKLAKDSGIPVYAIVLSSQRSGNPLIEIANDTGGLVFFGSKDTQPAFERIRDEVRGQYLISFRADDDSGPGKWRHIAVDVPNARVRSASGYFTR